VTNVGRNTVVTCGNVLTVKLHLKDHMYNNSLILLQYCRHLFTLCTLADNFVDKLADTVIFKSNHAHTETKVCHNEKKYLEISYS